MISFIRVDDRIIHGQIVTRWSKEYPFDGVIAVNDKSCNYTCIDTVIQG